MSLKLGCIADDFTGGTDLANNLVRAGMRTVQAIGVPAPDAATAADADAVVVALKSRTAPVGEAVAQSVAAARWLRAQGARQIYFKVCSTFDSTPRGNIGPVAEALMDELQAGFVVITPAFPENARTVFKGHLFVGDLLLSNSSMRHHPLTPMTDANLVRVLQAQLDPARGRRVGLIDYHCVAQGAAAIGRRIEALRAEGVSLAIVDALGDDDLRTLAQAVAGQALVVAGSGLAIGIPALHGMEANAQAATLPPPRGARAIVSGSCSAATNAQVASFVAAGGASFAIDPLQLDGAGDVIGRALAFAQAHLADGPVLVHATAEPAAVRAVQQQLGAERAGALVEEALSRIAVALVEGGVDQLVVAGGETSGACVQALGITQLRIGPQIDPGVPWCHARTPHRAEGLHLALKSGNFGGVDFFHRAFDKP
ncbi:MAG: four-carbon acid sugar kinase family protein [Ideonella sp.]|nr:four-carbon acid sugar kinase family protein [Ideonella sp.]